MGHVTEAIKRMFSRNTTNAASQSGARVPIVNVNGDPIGNDSLANLASVLGAGVFLAADVDLDNIRTPGTYYWNAQRTNQPTGTFSSAMVYYEVPYTVGWQVLYTNPDNYIYMRSYSHSSSTWSEWKQITT